MSVVLVDTSVWFLLFRRNGPASVPEVAALQRFLRGEELVAITGAIAQELIYGLSASNAADAVTQALAALPYLAPALEDHLAAARMQRLLRAEGIQMSGADALIVQLALTHDLLLLTTDRDFTHAARHVPLRLWTQGH
ncbi:PIN domain-containing protein [Xanthomonadaceae bacterium JHOS43]|nr:PIN domain-containing protein [Xanthomonadaceae bacterium JHOS43]MCX7562066.1 PIN domain-containing protein [Xanthomonadaceae bacterium XH05]